jgi:CHAT domain-containing protein
MAAYRLLILAAVSLAGVGDRSVPSWQVAYGHAVQRFNHAQFENARFAAESGYRTWRTQPNSRAHWQFRLLLAESLIELDPMNDALPQLQGTAPSSGEEARRLADLAMVYLREHDQEQTLQCLERARRVVPPDARDLLGEIDLIAGTVELQKDRMADAEATFRRALSAVQGSRTLMESYTLSNLGFLDLRRFRYDESVFWFEHARDLARQNGMQRALELALGNLGAGYLALGDFDRAIKNLSDAAALAEQLNDRVYRMRWLLVLGETWQQSGDTVKATECYQKARQLGNPERDQQWLSNVLGDLSDIALQKRDLPLAETLNAQGTALARQVNSSNALLAREIQSGDIAAARQEHEKAESLYKTALAHSRSAADPLSEFDCHARLASLYRQHGATADAEREYRAAAAATNEGRANLRQDESKFSFLSRLIAFYRDYVDFLIDRGDTRGAFRIAQSCRARVLEEKLHVDGSAGGADAASLEQESRATGAVLLSYWLAPRRSLLWVIDPKGLHTYELPAEDEIAAHVSRYSDAIERGASAATGDETGKWLFTNLLGAHYSAPKGSNIVIEPDGVLHRLNFESLPDGDAYWIENATVSIAPSLALLRRSEHAPLRRLLIFGDPGFEGSGFERLSGVKAELQAVENHFPEKRVYISSDATPAAYGESHPGIYSTIHFASHAVANRESPLDSAIILAGPPESRKLYAREILQQPLTAELVTLSACQTAGSRTYYGEGLTGFSWAFLSAGARNVVAGLWDVDDRATAILMDHFYSGLSSGLSPASALRRAKLDVMAGANVYRKPRYWAAFEIFTKALYR